MLSLSHVYYSVSYIITCHVSFYFHILFTYFHYFVIQPTREDREFYVNPFKGPMWIIAAAIPPALLSTILIFMDQQITAVIVNRKEHMLKVYITYAEGVNNIC